MTDVIKEESALVSELFWSAMSPEDFIKACHRETLLQYLEDLHADGEDFYCDF